MADIGIISIPNGLIEDLVRAAIVRELGDQTKLIEGIVRQALGAKKDSYSKETLFQAEVHKAIREAAQEAIKEWIQSNRDRVKQALLDHLLESNGIAAKKLAESLIDGISGYNIKVNFNWSLKS